jgi:hypothetical protein
MTRPLAEIRAYLDGLLMLASSANPEGNGLLVDGPEQVRRLGAALIPRGGRC